MRVQDILNHRDFSQQPEQPVEICHINEPTTARVAIVSVKVNGSSTLIGDGKPQNPNIFIGENLIMDFGDIEFCDVGINQQTGEHEWIVNIETYGLVVIQMSEHDTIPSIEKLLAETPVILDMNEGALQTCTTIEVCVTCRSVVICDFDDHAVRSFFRPKFCDEPGELI